MKTAAAMKNVSVIFLIVQIWISLQLFAGAVNGEYLNGIELSKRLLINVASSSAVNNLKLLIYFPIT